MPDWDHVVTLAQAEFPEVEISTSYGTPALKVCRLVHQLGGIAIPPHPYDLFRAGIRESVLDTLEMDGLEVFNAATTLPFCLLLKSTISRPFSRGLFSRPLAQPSSSFAGSFSPAALSCCSVTLPPC